MVKRMLIDATHAEETRVVVLNGQRLEEFDVETSTKRQLKGNIYLAKIVRVEPSLQAAFVDYGGGRHGFLAFNEIHPDYYQIPVADRQALLAEHRAGGAAASADFDDGDEHEHHHRGRGRRDQRHEPSPEGGIAAPPAESSEPGEGSGEHAGEPVEAEAHHDAEPDEASEISGAAVEEVEGEQHIEDAGGATVPDIGDAPEGAEAAADSASPEHEPHDDHASAEPAPTEAASEAENGEEESHSRSVPAAIPVAELVGPIAEAAEAAETSEIGGEDEVEEVAERPRRRPLRHYKIQEVIKRRQIVLVQVVKEERGTKGAALTTYLSLAGRYCVLMPNTARGGGVSRKITNAADRKRLKTIVNELEIPDGMAVIIRTAGSERTKPEIKRDYEYLLRLWDSVRELTLQSSAPALVYEEANLIKRSIRDLYARDIDEILVEGDEGYRLAKDFMRMLTPSHAKKVQLYKDPAIPMLHRFQVETQLDAMHSPSVQLKSGGYIVLNQTEALVAIDVNSGRATRERHIEETALKTNLEAADEVARQLRLRDLAGLIVIDFIDMEEGRNNHAVERRLKEAMRLDRARIQLGRISPFGLLELSRQRLRPSLMESSFQTCTHCGGTGFVRSVESSSVHVLRAIEDEGIRRHGGEIRVTVHTQIALYILNQKRPDLLDIEQRYSLRVQLAGDDSMIPPTHRIDRLKTEIAPQIPARPVHMETSIVEMPAETEVEEPIETSEEAAGEEHEHREPHHDEGRHESHPEGRHDDGEGGRGRRRRRRRRGRRDGSGQQHHDQQHGQRDFAPQSQPQAQPQDQEHDDTQGEEHSSPPVPVADGDPAPRRRRRGKRGGRRRNRHNRENGQQQFHNAEGAEGSESPAQHEGESHRGEAHADSHDVPYGPSEPARHVEEPRHEEPRRAESAPVESPRREPEPPAQPPAAVAEPAPKPRAPEPAPEPEPAGPPRRGWWNRVL